MPTPMPAVALTALAGLAALALSRGERRLPYALAKGVAAAGFVAVAVASGALGHLPGRLILAGLLASGVGDVALAFRGRRAFVAGMAAFALAHLAYIAAFLGRGVAPVALAVAAVIVGTAAWLAWRGLSPHLPPGLRRPVAAYVALISVMVAVAWAAVADGFPVAAGIGATAFFLSDLAVARERFVTRRWADKLWGLPLYYLGQVLIALSAG